MKPDALAAAELIGPPRFGVQLVCSQGAGHLLAFGPGGALRLWPVEVEGERLRVSGLPTEHRLGDWTAPLPTDLPAPVAAFLDRPARAAVEAQRRSARARKSLGLRERMVAEGWNPRFLAFLHDADLEAEDDVMVLDGRPHGVERSFCVNPTCGCHDAVLEWVELAAGSQQRLLGTALVDLRRRAVKQVDGEGEAYVATLKRLAAAALADPVRHQRLVAERDWLRGALAPPPALAIGRNDRCPCGSGKKYKLCHEGKPLVAAADPAVDWASIGRDAVRLLRPAADTGLCPAEALCDAPLPGVAALAVALLEAPLRAVVGQGPPGWVHLEGEDSVRALEPLPTGTAAFLLRLSTGPAAVAAPGLRAPSPPAASPLAELSQALLALTEPA